jgi:hypothetical protein
MQQLGVSLNAVHLHDVYEDDVNIHMVMELCEGWAGAWGVGWRGGGEGEGEGEG